MAKVNYYIHQYDTNENDYKKYTEVNRNYLENQNASSRGEIRCHTILCDDCFPKNEMSMYICVVVLDYILYRITNLCLYDSQSCN